MRRPFVDDAAEIRDSRALRGFGAALALTHLLSFAYFQQKGVAEMLPRAGDAICWPFFEDCHRVRHLFSEGAITVYLGVYAALAAASAALFLLRRTAGVAYALLVIANVMKLALFVQDYRMMGNYHYMPYLSSLAFLLLPDKRRLGRYLIVGYYIAAGTLKLNYEWLSGQGLIRPSILSGPLLEVACAYVVVLELVLVLGLLHRHRIVFYATLAQLAAFHAFSWHIVGFFYPCVMACLLALPLLDRLFAEPEPEAPRLGPLPLRPATAAALALFTAAQLAPYRYRGDPAVHGEGRMFALNMFDAKAQCHNLIVAHQGGEHVELSRPSSARIAVRVRCDPLLYFNWAKTLCRENRAAPDFDLDVFLVSKRTTDVEYRPAMAVLGFCAQDPSYDLFRANPWILK